MRGETPIKIAYYGECTDAPEENVTTGKQDINNKMQDFFMPFVMLLLESKVKYFYPTTVKPI